MGYYNTLGNYQFSARTADDIRGSAVYGISDEKLGKVDDVIFDPNTGNIRYAIVDTGGWLKTKRFIVPADRIRASVTHTDAFEVNVTKENIEKFPPYDENALESQADWGAYETQYRSSWPSSSAASNVEPSSRWSSFENRLRADRDRIVAGVVPGRQRKVS